MVIRVAVKGKRDPYQQVFVNGKKNRAHVVIAEKALGHALPNGAEVHHFDGNRFNNSPQNLVICPSRAYHFLLHTRQKALNAVGNANWKRCRYCKKWDEPNNLTLSTFSNGRNNAQHKECQRKRNKLRKSRAQNLS